MKKITLSLAVAVIALASCQKPETALPVAEQFSASVESFESPTKTSMTPEKYVVWSQNDRLAIFQGSTLADEYKVSDASVGKANGTFSIVADNSNINGEFSAGTELPCNVALYPYADDLTLIGSVLEDEGTIYEIEGLTLPAEQVYVEGSFANGAFPMVAVTETLSDHNLKFKNVFGAMKLSLRGTQSVKSIKVEGKNNEQLSGSATITVYADNSTPSVTMAGTDDAAKTVVLDCGSGVQLDEDVLTEFIISLPPVTFNKGFVVTINDIEGNVKTLETDKCNAILRSSILVMPGIVMCDDELIIASGTEEWNATYDWIKDNIVWIEERFNATSPAGPLCAEYAFTIRIPTEYKAYIFCYGTRATKAEHIIMEIEEYCSEMNRRGIVLEEDVYLPTWVNELDGREINVVGDNICMFGYYATYLHGEPGNGYVTYFPASGHTHCLDMLDVECSNYKKFKDHMEQITSFDYWYEYIKDFANQEEYGRKQSDDSIIRKAAQDYTDLYNQYYKNAEPIVYVNDGGALEIRNVYASGVDDQGNVVDKVTVVLVDDSGIYFEPMYFQVPNYFYTSASY